MYNHSSNKVKLFDGVEYGIKELYRCDYKLAIATGGGRNYLDSCLAQTSIKDNISVTKTSDDCFSKPHPQMCKEIMDELFIEPEKSLVIGDSIHDLQNADKFSSIIDYPYASYMDIWKLNSNQELIPWKTNWMVVCDDNTSTWTTLNNIRWLAEDTWFFEKIKTYSCRANSNVAWYRSNTKDQIFKLVTNSWYPAKRSWIYERENVDKKKSERIRYKDRIWTMVWNKIYRKRKK